MLADTRIGLEARNPLANRMRRWSVEIGQDLLGVWLVDVEFGRIGSKGRRLQHAFSDEPAAQAYVAQALRRRATAPVRIGVAYHCVHSSRAAQDLVSRAGIAMATAKARVV